MLVNAIFNGSAELLGVSVLNGCDVVPVDLSTSRSRRPPLRRPAAQESGLGHVFIRSRYENAESLRRGTC